MTGAASIGQGFKEFCPYAPPGKSMVAPLLMQADTPDPSRSAAGIMLHGVVDRIKLAFIDRNLRCYVFSRHGTQWHTK